MISHPAVIELEGAEVIVKDESSVMVADCVDVELADDPIDDGEADMEVIEAKKLP